VLPQIPSGLLSRRVAIQRRIDFLSYKLLSASPRQESALREQLEASVAEDEAVDARIRETAAMRDLGTPISSVAQLRQQWLPADSTLIEYHLAEPCSYAWLVGPRRIQVFILPSRAAVETLSRQVISLFGRLPDRQRSSELQARFRHALRELSAMVLGPFRDIAPPPRVIIVPDGILNQVPFAALELPEAKQPLGLQRDLMQVPSASFLAAGVRPRNVSEFPKALIGIADPVFSPEDPRVARRPRRSEGGPAFDLPRLPFTAELQEAVELLPGARTRILRGFDANLDALRMAHLEDYAVVHFSTHAFIDDRTPELSRIALSMVDSQGAPVDGFLSPAHLAEFHLYGSTVVLSACRTALGKQVIGEGLAGLTASLFQAGAAQLVLSLSQVDAEASAEFFREVYRNRFGPHQRKGACSSAPAVEDHNRENPDGAEVPFCAVAGEAGMEYSLTMARRALAGSSRWSDPYYWASFIIVGRPSGRP
jgi:CHAT domain-containing protein